VLAVGKAMSKQSSMQTTWSVIRPRQTVHAFCRELIRYREVFFFLSWRDIIVRYKQTVLGVAWVVIRPLLTMIIFSIVFGRLAGFARSDVAYPVLVYAGLIPWQLFTDSVSFGSNSLVNHASLVCKVYIPRIFIPMSSVVCSLFDALLATAMFFLLMMVYRVIPSWRLVYAPFFFVWAVILSCAATLLVAALNVRYRDIRFVVPFVIQMSMYVSPIGFSSAIIPIRWRMIYSMNPLVGIIDGFRYIFLGHSLYFPGMIVSLIVTILFSFGALWYFRTAEQTFADVM